MQYIFQVNSVVPVNIFVFDKVQSRFSHPIMIIVYTSSSTLHDTIFSIAFCKGFVQADNICICKTAPVI